MTPRGNRSILTKDYRILVLGGNFMRFPLYWWFLLAHFATLLFGLVGLLLILPNTGLIENLSPWVCRFSPLGCRAVGHCT